MEGVGGKCQELTSQEHPGIVLLCTSIEIWLCSYFRTGSKSSSLPPGPASWWKSASSGQAGEAPVQHHPSSDAALGSDLVCSVAWVLGSMAPAGRQLLCPRWEHSKLWLQPCLAHCISPGCWSTEVFTSFLGVRQYVLWLCLFCIAAVFLGPRGCHLTGTLAPHQASSPSSFPSEHPHTFSSSPYPALSAAFLDPCCPSHPTSLIRALPTPVALVRPS